MMDDHPMASAYRSPAERMGPPEHMGDSHQGYRWPRDGWQRDWRPDETPLYGVTGSGMSSGAMESRRGKAPKGYVRSDERLREEICERMAQHDHDWSDVEVQVQGGIVTLSGRVEDRRLRFQAEHIADGVRGVGEITNQIRVGRDSAAKDDAEGASENNGTRKDRQRASS
jgi:hypothetical protein